MDSLTEVRKAYLDLVQKCVINTIYEDPNQGFWSAKVFDRQLRDLNRRKIEDPIYNIDGIGAFWQKSAAGVNHSAESGLAASASAGT